MRNFYCFAVLLAFLIRKSIQIDRNGRTSFYIILTVVHSLCLHSEYNKKCCLMRQKSHRWHNNDLLLCDVIWYFIRNENIFFPLFLIVPVLLILLDKCGWPNWICCTQINCGRQSGQKKDETRKYIKIKEHKCWLRHTHGRTAATGETEEKCVCESFSASGSLLIQCK